MNNIRWIRW